MYINIYFLVTYSDKEEFWDSLIKLNEDQWHSDSIVGGDFNNVLFSMEKWVGSNVKDLFQERLEDILSEWDLMDVVPKKEKYTNKIIGSTHITTKL